MTKLKTQRLRDMVALSRRFGTDALLVQAAGGNVSAKFGDGLMAVKTSGVRLREVGPSKGWAYARVSDIREGALRLRGKAGSPKMEIAYADLLQQSSLTTTGPSISMEAGFHAALSDIYVAHTHSVAGIILGLMPRRLAIGAIQKFCGSGCSVQIVNPHLPGFELTQTMLKKNGGGKSALTLWLLQNHGLIWSGSKMEEIWKASQKLEKGLRSLFQFKRFPAPHRLGAKICVEPNIKSPEKIAGALQAWDICFCRWPVCTFDFQPLFPDLVIYFDLWGGASGDLIRLSERAVRILAATPKSARDKQEVFLAHALASTVAAQNGWRRPMPAAMGRSIKNLETERRRLAHIKNH